MVPSSPKTYAVIVTFRGEFRTGMVAIFIGFILLAILFGAGEITLWQS